MNVEKFRKLNFEILTTLQPEKASFSFIKK